MCGLLRQGKLLVEENPDFSMENHECPTLEAVFLQLSLAFDSSKSVSQPSDVVIQPLEDNIKTKSNKTQKSPTNRTNSLAHFQELGTEGSDAAINANPSHHHEQQRAPTMKLITQGKQA